MASGDHPAEILAALVDASFDIDGSERAADLMLELQFEWMSMEPGARNQFLILVLRAVEACKAAVLNGPRVVLEMFDQLTPRDPSVTEARGLADAALGNCREALTLVPEIKILSDDEFTTEMSLMKIFTLCGKLKKAEKHRKRAREVARSSAQKEAVDHWAANRM